MDCVSKVRHYADPNDLDKHTGIEDFRLEILFNSGIFTWSPKSEYQLSTTSGLHQM